MEHAEQSRCYNRGPGKDLDEVLDEDYNEAPGEGPEEAPYLAKV